MRYWDGKIAIGKLGYDSPQKEMIMKQTHSNVWKDSTTDTK
jgi:hypothetical protein